MRIYLVGFMGAGKTSVGEILAERLGVQFVDLDLEIEREQGRTIKEIFASEGEPYFRHCERSALVRLRSVEDLVVATGGGTFTFPENRTLIQEGGVSVHLAAPFDVIASRIGSRHEDRPLFRDERAAFELYNSRQVHYRLADVAVAITPAETPKEIAERVVLALPRGIERTSR